MRTIRWKAFILWLAISGGLILIVSMIWPAAWKIYVSSPNSHQAYLFDVPAEQFNRPAFEDKSDDYDLDYDFIEAESRCAEIYFSSSGSLSAQFVEMASANQKAGLVLIPRAKFDKVYLQVTAKTVYLKKYYLDKQGNYTEKYDYQIWAKQANGRYQLVERGTDIEKF